MRRYHGSVPGPRIPLPVSTWSTRRGVTALGATAVYVLLIAVPTDLIDTPAFGRKIPPTWWSWPGVLVSAVLAGLLTATYVRPGGAAAERPTLDRGGAAGGLLTFFAVGCPVCNKLVLVALGSAGALTWFEHVQPVLQLAAIAVLAWALRRRLGNENACRVPDPPPSTVGV